MDDAVEQTAFANFSLFKSDNVRRLWNTSKPSVITVAVPNIQGTRKGGKEAGKCHLAMASNHDLQKVRYD